MSHVYGSAMLKAVKSSIGNGSIKSEVVYFIGLIDANNT